MLLSYLNSIRWLILPVALYGVMLSLKAGGINIWLPGCIISETTGYQCLGCGINHAAMALLQGDFAAAIDYNFMIFIYPVAFAFWLIRDYRRYIINQKTNHNHEQV